MSPYESLKPWPQVLKCTVLEPFPQFSGLTRSARMSPGHLGRSLRDKRAPGAQTLGAPRESLSLLSFAVVVLWCCGGSAGMASCLCVEQRRLFILRLQTHMVAYPSESIQDAQKEHKVGATEHPINRSV